MLNWFRAKTAFLALSMFLCTAVSFADNAFEPMPNNLEDQPIDATQLFKKHAEGFFEPLAFAETAVEAKSAIESMLDEPGLLAYADRKPPQVGDVEVFNSVNLASNSPIRIQAVLKKIGTHCYVYLEKGQRVDDKTIANIAAHFDRKIVPQVRSMFGSEWSPGIDGDKRITLLLMNIRDGYDPSRGRNTFTSGYFNAGDEFPRSKNSNSNQREMLYLDTYPGKAGSVKFLSVLAHEYQHMVHWYHDPKEFDWVDESLSQLAPFLCGYGHPPQVMAFVRSPDNNLCAWSQKTALANYGQVYLWAYYIATHIASTEDRRREFVRKMVDQKSQGLSGLNAAIKKQKIKNNVANLFRSFSLANYLNDSRLARGAYGYDKHLAKLMIRPDLRVTGFPVRGKSSVKPWSARAVNIDQVSAIRGKEIQIDFAGQKVAAGKYANSFDVAFVSYSSDRKAVPSVEWLTIREYKGRLKVKVPANHNRAFLLVVNRGSTVMKVEQTYASGAKPAVFSFSLSYDGAPVATTRSSSSSRRRVDRASARRMLDEIVQSPFSPEDLNANILAQRDDTEANADDVAFELAFQKIADSEEELVQQIRSDIAEGDTGLLEMVTQVYLAQNEDGKVKLEPLKSRIVDILKFEQLQGNETFNSWIDQLDI